MKHRKPLVQWTVLALVLLVIGGVVALAFIRRGAGAGESAPRVMRPAAVDITTVRTGVIRQTVRGIGTLRPFAAVDITPEISGRVRTIHFEEGAAVRQGDVLIELADDKLQQQLASNTAGLRAAEARLTHSRLTFERIEDAHSHGAATQFEFDRARADYDAAVADIERYTAEVELVREQLTDTRIIAPFDGVISERRVDAGALLSIGQPIATLFSIASLEMTFGVPERHMGGVHVGQAVEVTVAAYRGRTFRGDVTFVAPEVRESTRDFVVKAIIANPDYELKPGGSATAVIVVDERTNATIVPEEALVGTRQGYIVFAVKLGPPDIAQRREIEIGLRQEGIVEIVSGVAPGDLIVRAGQLRVADGMPLRILNRPQDATTTEVVTKDESGERGGS